VTLTIVSKTDFKIMIEGTATGGNQGDISIDDVMMDFVPCLNSTKTPRPGRLCLNCVNFMFKHLDLVLKLLRGYGF